MFKRISMTMTVVYGLIIIVTIISLDITFIYAYQKKLQDKNESKNVTYGNIISNLEKDKFEDLLLLNQSMRENSAHIDGRVLILNAEGIVLADKYEADLGKKIKNNYINQSISHGIETIGYYREGTHRIMIVSTPIKYRNMIEGAAVISVFLDSIFTDIQDLKKQLFVISMFASIFAIAFSFYMGNKLSKPIEKLTKATEAIRLDKLDTRVDIKRNDEIGKLAEAFNQMSTQIYNIDITRRRFLSDISHELNTPLTSIKALIEALIEGENDIPIYKEYLRDVNGEVDRLSILIKALLTITRFEDMEIKKEPIRIYNEIEAITRLFYPLLEEKAIVLTNHCDKMLMVEADKGMLREVLVNLIDNSIKYGNEKGKIEISSDNNRILTIRDNGIGIPQKDIPFIFDLFFRVDKSRNGDTGGRGIGLYLVKKIITLHGWDIQVNSELGEKTEFIIEFKQ